MRVESNQCHVVCRREGSQAQASASGSAVRPKSKLELMMEEDRRKQQILDKQKADRAASTSNGRKDEPWLTEGIIVKVGSHACSCSQS